jgi:hypothetical protein
MREEARRFEKVSARIHGPFRGYGKRKRTVRAFSDIALQQSALRVSIKT